MKRLHSSCKGPVLAAVKKDAKDVVCAREMDKSVVMRIYKANLFVYAYAVLICVDIRARCENLRCKHSDGGAVAPLCRRSLMAFDQYGRSTPQMAYCKPFDQKHLLQETFQHRMRQVPSRLQMCADGSQKCRRKQGYASPKPANNGRTGIAQPNETEVGGKSRHFMSYAGMLLIASRKNTYRILSC